MSIEVARIGTPSFDASHGGPPRGARTAAAAGAEDAAMLSNEIPSTPPQEVLDAVDAAGRVYRELHAQGRELRFAVDPDGGRVQVQVCDLDGNVLRTIPPDELLDIATGALLD